MEKTATAISHESTNDDDPFQTVDEAAAFYADAYRKFIFLRGVIDHFPNELLNPSEFRLPRPARSLMGEFQFATAEDFARLLANRVNSFLAIVMGLKSWQQILPEYEKTPRRYLEVEFVWPLLQLGLSEPSAIRNQAIFSVTKMAILTDSFDLHHDIPGDHEIDLRMLDCWAAHWPEYDHFRSHLAAVNPRDFVAATRNFRNRRAHALAPSPFGIIPAHVVSKKGRDWKMIWRHEPRLEIDQLVERLVQQHVASVSLVERVRSLFRARFG